MATDNGPASGNGELNIGSFPTAVFMEQHVQGPVTTAASSGVPGGLSGPSSALNNVGPGDFSGSSAQAYGTVPTGSAATGIFLRAANFITNPSGAGNLPGFHIKNPA